MRILIQRVRKAKVKVEGDLIDFIGQGLLVFLGIENEDDTNDLVWLVNKLLHLRIFNDEKQVMNLSLLDVKGELMVVSQFTLMAATKKGNRPSYIRAASHQIAIPLYEKFLLLAEESLGNRVARGVFGADMKISLINDGPVTIFIDSKNKE